jgi:hypothetical protein
MEKKVLIILPQCYTNLNATSIPNSISKNKHLKRIPLTVQEKEFITYLIEENIVYSVPTGANDDWYWIYATLYEQKSEKKTYVVTNDLMRDHKLSILTPIPFIRWRTSFVVYYQINRPMILFSENNKLNNSNNEEDLDHDEVLLTSAGYTAVMHPSGNIPPTKPPPNITPQQNNTSNRLNLTKAELKSIVNRNELNLSNSNVTFYQPGNFSREIQRSSSHHPVSSQPASSRGTGRWHIPALDRHEWLCINLNAAFKGNNADAADTEKDKDHNTAEMN